MWHPLVAGTKTIKKMYPKNEISGVWNEKELKKNKKTITT